MHPSSPARVARETRAAEIAAGRLVVVNNGIGDTRAALPFYQNEFSEWSSFHAGSKATGKLSHQVVAVVQPAPKPTPAATPDTNPLTAHRDALLARLDRDGPTLFTEEWLNRARQALRYMVPWTQAAGALGTGARRCLEVGGGEAPSR